MKNTFFISLLLCSLAVQAQQTQQDCTNESVQNEPGRFLDAHTGGATGGAKSGFTAAEVANARKMMQAFENVCKPKLKFTGGQAKASFGLNSRPFYNHEFANSYTYNLGFHQFVCNINTHKLAIVDEYQGVLRVIGNPWFQRAFSSFEGDADAYKIPANARNVNAPFIAVYNYFSFADSKLVNAINNGNGFIDLTAGEVGSYPIQLVENKPGKGFGYTSSNNNFVTLNNEMIFRHAFITHTEIPFFIPVSRKKFLTDLLEFYDREKPELVRNMQEKIKTLSKTIAESEKSKSSYLQSQKDKLTLYEQSAREILPINEQKKQTVAKLLQSKDEKWLNQQAVVQFDNKSFTIPYDRNRYLKEVYGNFYFTEFYTGTTGLYLYQINPDYLKKYPPDGAKPSVVDVVYRFRPNDNFLMGVIESFIKQLDLNEFRKLLQ